MSARGLTAWERWELASFDEARSDTENAVSPALTSDEPAPVAGPDPAELALAALRQSTYDEAFAAGRHDGYADGHKEGYAAGEQAGEKAARASAEAQCREQAEKLAALCARFEQQLQALDNVVAEELLDLTLDIARKLVGQTLGVRPEAVVGIIHAALAELPVQHAAIHLHPDDASLARLYAGDALTHAGQRIHENPKLARGDVLIEAGGSQVDATLATRWRRIVDALGRNAATAGATSIATPVAEPPDDESASPA